MSHTTIHRHSRRVLGIVTTAAGLAVLAACSDPAGAGDGQSTAKVGNVSYDLSAKQKHPTTTKNAAAAAQLPAEIREAGVLVVGRSDSGTAPLGFVADDNRTPIGVEVDLAHLVASALGLKVEVQQTSWENLFVGIDSGKYDAAASNVGVSEERKEKYEFATYRLGLHAFEAKKGSGLSVKGPTDIAGKKVAVGSGALQEDVLIRWNEENVKAGRPEAELKYYQNASDYYLALQSGRVDLYLGPNPVATYHVATAKQSEIVGTVSSSYPIPGLVGFAAKKGSGLAAPLSAGVNATIADGSYEKVLAKWGLTGEAVPKSEINPPGLPKPTTTK